ncbi:MAG TPA: ParM/StbA family protein [Candidatus Nitrosocosmicus sp.]|nr:ParM/StbA family protein [Candidatus Nitrosocosmicus sp.]
MILGVDLGNYAVKTSKEVIFPSKCTKAANILSSSPVLTEEGKIYIGEGSFDTEYRKVKKAHLRTLFLYAVALSSADLSNKVVVGLPISQFQQEKDELKNILLPQRINTIGVNGISRKICIDDIEVYPEGIGAITGSEYEGIVIDIGGRTTDVCLVSDHDGNKKVKNPYSIAKGTLNLYSDFIKAINSKYGLDLSPDDADRILKKGLRVDGDNVDCSFAIEIFRQYVEELVNYLQVEYSLRTQEVLLIGGGSQLLYKALKNRIPGARLADNAVFANAVGFRKVGEQLWL